MATPLRIGCSGWSYKHWRNDFYPQGVPQTRWFEHYASVFDTVELNASFYRLPSEAAVRGWREKAPEGFVFSVKASRLITHFLRLKGTQGALDTFLDRVEGLAAHLGPVLFQLPPDYAPDHERLEAFLEALPRPRDYVFEFRSREWWTNATFALLRRHGAAFCMYNAGGTSTPVVATAPFSYIRFHGPSTGYSGGYSDAQLRDWSKTLRDIGAEAAYVYFNNDIGGHAPRDAVRLRELIEG